MPGGTAPVGTHHQPRLENGRGFGEFADDRGELAVKPVLVPQTNAQNWSSTAPEPTGVQVLPPSRIADHQFAPAPQSRVDMCPLA